MAEFLKITAYIINVIHDLISVIARKLNFTATDKDLHFWVIGAIGIIIFLITDAIFKRIAKWGVSVVSFVYTFTVLIVIVFAMEIEQKITGRGNMEFRDIVAGLWGFLVVFAVYLCLKVIIYLYNKLMGKKKNGKTTG
jgi:hypothetical protein